MQYSVPFRTVVSTAHGRVGNWMDRGLGKEATRWYQGLVKGHYEAGQAYFGDPGEWPEPGADEPVVGYEVWVAAPERSRTEQVDERTGRRCGASSVISVRYGATNTHSSSETSLG